MSVRVTRETLDRAIEALKTIRIEVDSSEVMASPHAFLAKLDHREGIVTLNGRYLATLSDDEARNQRVFLVFHELGHLFFGDDEGLCDELGRLAVEKRIALSEN